MLRDLWQKLSPEMRFVNALENDEVKLGIHTAVPAPETLQQVLQETRAHIMQNRTMPQSVRKQEAQLPLGNRASAMH